MRCYPDYPNKIHLKQKQKGGQSVKKLRVVLFLLGIIMLSGVAAMAAEKMLMQDTSVEYSADEYMEAEGMTMHSKVYHSRGKMRKEMDAGGMKQIMINRMDKKLTWMLMPEEKMYMEMKMGEPRQQKEPDLEDYKVDYTVLGDEVVNGINTTKSKVVVTDPQGHKFEGLMWEAKEGILVKMDATGKAEGRNVRMKIELKNIKITNQDPKLFEIPAGYKNMSMPPMPGMGGGGFNMKDMMKNFR